MKKLIRPGAPDSSLVTDSIIDDLDSIGLQRVDEAAAVPRPGSVQTFYVEEEIDYRASEQVLQWQAEGLAAARPADEEIGGLTPYVTDLENRIGEARELADQAKVDLQATLAGLAHHVRRAHGTAKLFYLRMLLLLLGDIAGVSSAAINFGVVPWMAVVQALAIGAAATTAGLAGSEWKDLQRARDLERPPDELTEAEQPYTKVFAGPKAGERYTTLGVYVAASVLLLIFGGVFAVQGASDGLTAGLLFGCLGAAIGLASAVNYWAYSDYVADLVGNARARHAGAEAVLSKLTADAQRKAHGEAVATRTSIIEEHELRGQAARLQLLALGRQIMRNNTGVVGHGHEASSVQLGRENERNGNGHVPMKAVS